MTSETRHEMRVRVAISASESPDITAFGLSGEHLRDAMADLALQVLAADMDIVYGGDLRKYGLTELLFELVTRYTPPEDVRRSTRVTNHLAWPVHIAMSIKQIECVAAELRGIAKLVLVGDDGVPMALQTRRGLSTRNASTKEWITGLTAMRRHQRSCTDARVVLGGRITGYRGRMPGVAEEALLSIRTRQPLFLVGGFGGSAREVAETLGLAKPWSGSRRNWPGQQEFEGWISDSLNNGLSHEENETLATTPFIGQAIVLILRGLYRLKGNRTTGEAEDTAHA